MSGLDNNFVKNHTFKFKPPPIKEQQLDKNVTKDFFHSNVENRE